MQETRVEKSLSYFNYHMGPIDALGFISMGCKTDRDCAYHNQDGSEELNFQSCRVYPSKTLPTSNSTNGCICLNYIVGTRIDGSTGKVYCTNNDAGTIAIYVLDLIILLFQMFISFRCLYILLIFGKLKLNQLRRYGMRRDRPVSLVKRHALLCLLFLLMTCFCFFIFRVLSNVGYIKAWPSDIDFPTRQARFDQGSLRAPLWFCYMFLGQCCLHFTILWLSTTRALFSEEAAKNSGGCFNVRVYKRFINAVQVIYFILVIALVSTKIGINLVNFVVLASGVVIIYEFVWGCRNITRLLKLIASWSKAGRLSSSSGGAIAHETDTAAKLLNVAEKIDRFSSRIRISGGLLLLAYGCNIVMNFFGL